MFRTKTWLMLLLAACAVEGGAAYANVSVTENFTGAATVNSWFYFGGACLTASSAVGTGSYSYGPGSPPGCTADGAYYQLHNPDEVLDGGYNGTATGYVSFGSATPLDPVGDGALRFTNGCMNSTLNPCSESPGGGGHNENGAIISADTFSTNQGLDITFKTVSYRGDSGGTGDGADGMSFFLIDASQWSPTVDPIGSYGGSLGYSCSNQNNQETDPYHGMVGGYLGLGIDEYGNFLNGYQNTLNETGTNSGVEGPYHDNTASGGYYMPNRIGLRGAGNIAWSWLNENYPNEYPSSLSSSQQAAAVQQTCATGYLYQTSTPVMDYPAIPNAYEVIPSKIANEYSSGGYSRQDATPITYHLKITSNGLLSLWYSYNGGSWIGVLENQNITNSNGPLPDALRFGFAGSSGGSTNIHELLCFKATPATQSLSSSTVNQEESSRVEDGSQAYFSYYDPSDWTGDLTAYELLTNSTGALTIASSANWDASCVLTGVASGSTCPSTGQSGSIAAESPASRVMLTWSGSAGIPFEWTNLTAAEQSALDAGSTTTVGQDRLEYLRGDRSNEMTPSGTGLFRDRDSVLGDIVDSSPAWVGPPAKMIFSAYEFPTTWQDDLYPTTTMPENSGQSYSQYVSTEATRLNVVYVGANDGLLHGFAAGSYDSTGTVYNSSTNTGQEVLAYMPQAVLDDIHNSSNANLDYSNPQYGHNFYVDATPGVGDLYYNGAWHTWLVSGLGAGGADIFALDVTNPANFSEGNAASLVIGDWTPATLTCSNVSNCGNNLGNTYGTPVIRRLHNGDWGIIFGNGLGSASGDAGIYVMTVNPSTAAITTYYLSTGQAGKSDGIAYVSPVAMAGDHITDYVYAGDVNGNVWRFDLTSSNPSNWAVTPGPIFTTPNGQPITSLVQPAFVTNASSGAIQVMLYFGTGEQFPITNSSAPSFASGTQSFYGVWDWNMDSWNAHALTQFASLSSTQMASLTGTSASTLSVSNLVQQTVTTDSSNNRNIDTTNPICWAGTQTCTGTDNQFGWYINLPGTNAEYNQTTYEQVVFNPQIISTAVVFNSTLPGIDSPLACNAGAAQGWTYAIDARTGGAVPDFFVNNGNTHTIAYPSDASGTDSVVTTTGTGSNGATIVNDWLVYQTNLGQHGEQQINTANDITGSRATWIELR
jgi:type IV pilus assembly protein PilY1